KEVQTAINMYQTGKLDMVGLDASNVSKYKDREDFSTELNSSNYFFRINNTKNKDLKNEDLRKAFAKSIDKKEYVNSLLNNGSVPSDKLMVKDFVKDEDGKDYIDGVKSPLNYDKEEAKKLLEKAKKATEFVKEQVEKNLPGVTLKIKQQPFKQKLALESKGDYDISFAGWGPDYPDSTTFLDLFKKDSPHNQTGYSNAEYDKALKEANTDEMLKEENSEKRTKMLQDAESKFLESASIGPLYQQGVARLRQPYVKNWQPHKFGGDYSLKEVEIAGSK